MRNWLVEQKDSTLLISTLTTPKSLLWVGILYSSRLILLYSLLFRGQTDCRDRLSVACRTASDGKLGGAQERGYCREPSRSHGYKFTYRHTHIMLSNLLDNFFNDFLFCESRSVCENHENLYPAKICHYTVHASTSMLSVDTYSIFTLHAHANLSIAKSTVRI